MKETYFTMNRAVFVPFLMHLWTPTLNTVF